MTDTVYRTAPQQELAAVEEAKQAGIEAHVPRQKVWRRAGRNGTRVAQVTQVIAPGYVFAEKKPQESRHFRNRLGTISKTESQHVKSLDGVVHENPYAPPPPTDWSTGDTGEIISGPFAGTKIKVVEIRGKTALIVEGTWDGSARTIALNRNQLAKRTHASANPSSQPP